MTFIAAFKRIFFTLINLKPIQFYGRLWFYLYRPIVKSFLVETPIFRTFEKEWDEKKSSNINLLIYPSKFHFLNKTAVIDENWGVPISEKLWQYNLHYFDYLFRYDKSCINESYLNFLIEDWVNKNLDYQGIGWEPYPLSLRLVNWSKYYLSGNTFPKKVQKSFVLQALYLSKRIEHHLQGNHLLANAKGLIFAGAILESQENLFYKGMNLFKEELNKQFFEDGGHFEKSPMYHAILLNDLLEIIQLSQLLTHLFNPIDVKKFKQKANKLYFWLQVMTHPSGEISYFNDSVVGIAEPLDHLEAKIQALDIDIKIYDNQTIFLEDSGYARLVNKSKSVDCIFDIGTIGPNHQMGHAHADIGSIEVSFNKTKMITNLGISTYESNHKRQFDRSTKAHSTLAINNYNSSDVWSAFRVGRRVKKIKNFVDCSYNRAFVEHDGYRWLKGNPIHKRILNLGTDALEITDQVKSKKELNCADIFIHLVPGTIVEALSGKDFLVIKDNVKVKLNSSLLEGKVEQSNYSHSFGMLSETASIKFSIKEFEGFENTISFQIINN